MKEIQLTFHETNPSARRAAGPHAVWPEGAGRGSEHPMDRAKRSSSRTRTAEVPESESHWQQRFRDGCPDAIRGGMDENIYNPAREN